MSRIWNEEIDNFLSLSDKYNIDMLMIGGGAVNFHGYQRHSADVDFWFNPISENFEKLIQVFKEMGYDIDSFPEAVYNRKQNISLKFSPNELNVELITNFNINKSFEEAKKHSEIVHYNGKKTYKYLVLSLNDLIVSKIKSGRTKDYLDILELKRINNLD